MFRKCQTKLPDSRLQIVWLVVLISSARNEQLEKSNDPLGMRMKDMLKSNSLNRHREKEKCALNVFWNGIALSPLYIMAEKYGKKSVHSNQWVYVCKFVVFQNSFRFGSKIPILSFTIPESLSSLHFIVVFISVFRSINKEITMTCTSTII